MVIVVLW